MLAFALLSGLLSLPALSTPVQLSFGPQAAAPSSTANTSGQAQERVVEVRIQGNTRTAEEEIRTLAAIQIGEPVTTELLAAIQTRLERSGKFDEVEIRKRWRTIDSTEDIVLVIIVREAVGGSTNVLRRAGHALTHPLMLPLATYDDGYGVTYGARLSPLNLFGPTVHVSIPLTWGATKQAALELDRPFSSGPVSRIAGAVEWRRRDNPFFDSDDRRITATARVERTIVPALRAGVSASLSDVSFVSDEREQDEPLDEQMMWDLQETLGSWGADITWDTRRNTDLPRNAVLVSLAWDRLHIAGAAIDRYRADAAGFVGLPRGAVLVLHAWRSDASTPLPPFEQVLLGGASNLRGFRAGYDAGDTLLTGSAELRVPLSSPLSFGRAGASLFVDTGAVYDHDTAFRDASRRTGVGGGLFFNAAVFKLDLAVARGLDRGWRLHVSAGLRF